MAYGIGIFIAERIAAAAVANHAVVAPVVAFPEDHSMSDALHGMPAENIVSQIVYLVEGLKLKDAPTHVGIGMPGIVRNGVIEDSPNLIQFKGVNMKALVEAALARIMGPVRVEIFNDADVVAAGIAATRGHLDRLIRVWTLGNGIGYGRYPFLEGFWEAGHMVVTLDAKEHYCGCGGRGHLEGIMGHRAMRLRFMDMEPEDIFEQAKGGDARCVDFVKMWHRALAAATATSIHLDGPGKFYVTGFNARFLNPTLLLEYLNEMVKLSPLQGYSIEIVEGSEDAATIGAAVNAAQAVTRQ
ncbi:MAG TPA: ROK family protein [Bryobacteraceae bacterium]|jgi:predicted NBD/HSP70 family sugar kinase|nr:ROK family protein [Bryobacteraceae bacterium]